MGEELWWMLREEELLRLGNQEDLVSGVNPACPGKSLGSTCQEALDAFFHFP